MSTLLLGGPICYYRHHYSATAVGPPANVDIATWWAHSLLSTSLFGDGCGPIRECRHCYSVGPLRIIGIIIWRRLWAHPRMSTLLLGGPIRYYRHHYSATAVGPYANVDIATWWAHSLLSASLFGDRCGHIREYRDCVSVGPLRIIGITIRRRLWAHPRISTLLLGGPTQDYRHHYSATAVGPSANIDIAPWVALSLLSAVLIDD